MERKLPGKFFRKFGNSFRGWPLFWKFWKMLFHSLTGVVANSKPTFWLIFWKSFTHSNTHYVFHNWAVTVTGWLWSVKNLQVNLMWSYFDFRYMCLLYRDWRHVSSMTKITTSRKLYSTGTIQRVTSLFTFFLISIRLNSKKSWPYIWTKCKSWKIWLNWAIWAIFSSIQVILKDLSAIKNCEIAVWQKSWWAIHSL